MKCINNRPHFGFEDQYGSPVCGIDEVGRGSLAGPVVAAAVIIDRVKAPLQILEQINDSKKLTAVKRAYLFQKIPEFCEVSIAECSVEEIDNINILQASLLAMKKAFDALPVMPKAALVDGNKAPKLSCAVKTIIQGDSHSMSIAAASIMAKHYRDQIMKTYAIDFPHYGWDSNSGYGSKQHMQAIEIHGITRHHRRSFAPISKQLLKLNAVNN